MIFKYIFFKYKGLPVLILPSIERFIKLHTYAIEKHPSVFKKFTNFEAKLPFGLNFCFEWKKNNPYELISINLRVDLTNTLFFQAC